VARDVGTAQHPCPPYKIIILDEADLMTSDAQNALRRTMEHYSKVTRFCLVCNYVTRIIDPLTSRCAKFRFKPIEVTNIETRLTLIAEKEGVKASAEILASVAKQSSGDMRKAITFLQSAHRLYGDEISLDAISVIAGVVPDNEVNELMAAIKGVSLARVQTVVNKLCADGYSVAQIIEQMHDEVMKDGAFQSLQKAPMLEAIAEADLRLLDGADEFLQLLGVCSTCIRVLS